MKLNKIILLIILTLGIFIRFFNIESNPPSIYWDEASIGYEAYSISQTGKDMHGNSWFQAIFPGYGDYKAPVYIWLASISIKLFGPTTSAIRIPSALFGSLSILAIYFLSKEIFKKESIALATATALTLLPGHIQFSRAGFEANVALFFIILFLLFLQIGIKKKQYIVYSSLPAIIATYTYFSARVIIPLILFLWLISNIKNIKKIILPSILFILIFVIGYIPIFNSPHYQNSNILRLSTESVLDNHPQIVYANSLRLADGNTLLSRIIHHRFTYTTKEFLINMSDHFSSSFLFFSGDPNPRHSTGLSGVALPTSIILFIIGLLSLIKNKKHVFYILSLWIVFLIPASIPTKTPHLLRSLGSLIPISIILGLGLSKSIKLLKLSKTNKNSLRFFSFIYIFILLINFSAFYYHLQTIYPKENNIAWQDGYPQLAKYINDNYHQYDQIMAPPGDRFFLYALYYLQYPPKDIQASQADNLINNPNSFSISKFGKVELTNIDWTKFENISQNTLVITNIDNTPKDIAIKDTIKDINQNPIYVSLEL